MAPKKDDKGDKGSDGAKEPFEKASDEEVPLWMQVVLLGQILLARLLTQKQDEPVPELKPLARAEQANPVEQLRSGHFRFYSPAELDRLQDITYQLKDIVQTNCVAMAGFEQATVKDDSPQAAELCRSMNDMGLKARIDSETALGTFVLWLQQIGSFRQSAATLYEPRPHEERLPVVDCERQLVTDIADSIKRAYTNMYSMQQKLGRAQLLLNIPQLDRITAEYAKHGDKIDALVAEISQFAISSLGQLPPAPARVPAAPESPRVT